MPPFTHPLKYPLDNKLPLWQSSTLQHTGICCARQYLSLNSCTSSQAIHGIQPQHKAAGSFRLRFRSTLTQQRGASTAPEDSFAQPLQTTKQTHDARLDASCVRQPSNNKQGTTLHACRQVARGLWCRIQGAGHSCKQTTATAARAATPAMFFAGAVASQVQPSTQQEQARKARNSTAHVSGHLVCPKSALCDATGSYTAAAATPAANTCNPCPSMGTSHQQCQVLYNTTARERIRAKTLCETYKRQPSMRALCV